MRPEDTAKHWHDAFDRVLNNTLHTHAFEPEALPPKSMRVGSIPQRGRLPYDVPFVVDPNLPPWLCVMVEQKPATFREFHWPRYVFLDMRAHPQTDDMGTMLDDLRRAGAVPAP